MLFDDNDNQFYVIVLDEDDTKGLYCKNNVWKIW